MERRTFIQCLLGGGAVVLGSVPLVSFLHDQFVPKTSLEDMISKMRKYHYADYSESFARYRLFMTKETLGEKRAEIKLRKAKKNLEQATEDLFEKNNPIDIGSAKNPRSASRIRKDFLKKGYVFFRFSHPMIGDLTDEMKNNLIEKGGRSIARLNALDSLFNTKNVYLGKILHQGNTSKFGCDESYDYFITESRLSDQQSIITFDDYLSEFYWLSNGLAFWNYKGKIYENRAVIKRGAEHKINDWAKYQSGKKKVKTTGDILKNAVVEQWIDAIPKDQRSKASIIAKGIRQREKRIMCFHEPTLINGGTETDGYLNQTRYLDDKGNPSFEVFLDIYLISQNKNNPFYRFAKEFKEILGITDFEDVLNNPKRYVY